MSVASAPGDYERLFIVEQRGLVKVLNLLTGQVSPDPFLDMEDTVFFNFERGLDSIVFHPDYQENGYFFVKYSALGSDTIISRFSVDGTNPGRADSTSEQVLLVVPQGGSQCHKGGNLAFHPLNGYLYVPLGDSNTDATSQDPTNLNGKLLRIDVDTRFPYAVPSDNPFTAVNDPRDEVRDEIWSIGLRNPFRMGFDQLTGDLYIGDVGEHSFEEVNVQSTDSMGGQNYGWDCMEGSQCTGASNCTCPGSEFTDPYFSFDHATYGPSCVIGGYVYRGSALDGLQGTYFYANFTYSAFDKDKFFSFVPNENGISGFTDRTNEIQPRASGLRIARAVAFGEDAFGELYVVDRPDTSEGEVYKIVPDDIEDRDCNGNLILDSAELAAGITADCNSNRIPDLCEIADGRVHDVNGDLIPDSCQEFFIRGDGTGDGASGIDDAIHTLNYLFQGQSTPCHDALDSNDDGVLDVSDPIRILMFVFLAGEPPGGPFPKCGADPSADKLACSLHRLCI